MRHQLRYKLLGGHVHVDVFQCTMGEQWEKNGSLIFDEPGWDSFKGCLISGDMTDHEEKPGPDGWTHLVVS